MGGFLKYGKMRGVFYKSHFYKFLFWFNLFLIRRRAYSRACYVENKPCAVGTDADDRKESLFQCVKSAFSEDVFVEVKQTFRDV